MKPWPAQTAGQAEGLPGKLVVSRERRVMDRVDHSLATPH